MLGSLRGTIHIVVLYTHAGNTHNILNVQNLIKHMFGYARHTKEGCVFGAARGAHATEWTFATRQSIVTLYTAPRWRSASGVSRVGPVPVTAVTSLGHGSRVAFLKDTSLGTFHGRAGAPG